MSGVAIVVAAAGVAAAQAQRQDDVEQVKARQRISMMEAVLERAVSNGADNMLRQVRNVMPEAPMLTGAPQVRGFRLDGFGVFFDVDVPALRIPMSWTLRYMVDQNGISASAALADLSAMVGNVRDANERARLQQAIQRLELQVGPAPRALARNASLGPATVTAQTVQSSAPPPAAPVDAGVVEDPNEAFTREVKAALIDAMLENSGPIAIGPDEWLVVAARDNIRPDRLVPTDATDMQTLMFRVKGSDLAAFRAGRITQDEARKRVEVREY
jgi:hypothetical protein